MRRDPIRQVIGVGIGHIVKPAFFRDKIDRIGRTPPGIPATRARASHLGMKADRLENIGLFILGRVILVFDPFQPVACDFPIGILHGAHLFGIARKG